MKQLALSISQMEHLEELGLNTSDATMIWEKSSDQHLSRLGINNLKEEEKKYFLRSYAYTLQDILNNLPDTILKDNICTGLVIMKSMINIVEQYKVCYQYNDTELIQSTPTFKGTLLEATYNLLCWCIENGYVKTDKDKT